VPGPRRTGARVNHGGVLVVGIDGGTWDVFRPLAERGVMPNMRRVLDQGAHGELTSVVPWYTIPGWASLMTGANPGRHGLLHWVRSGVEDYWESRRPGRPFTASTDLRLPTFWDVAGAAGKRVAVVNMPLTFPAWPVNGVMVTGLLTPAGDIPGQSHPEGFLADYPEYRVDLRHAKGREAEGSLPPLQQLLQEMVDVTESRRRLMTDLTSGDRDLMVAVFVGMDRVSHRVWPQQERLLAGDESTWGELEGLLAAYYRSLDSVIGSLLEAAGPDATTLFVSDHGFGRGPDRKFRANAWLRDAGYLALRGGRMQQAAHASGGLKKVASRAVKAYRRRARRPAEHVGVHMGGTRAYAVHFSWCPVFGIAVNERGVKREGSVDPADVPALLDRLTEDLLRIEDPDASGAVVLRVMRREEVADGPELARLPHLFVELDPRYFPDDGLRRREVFEPLQTNSGRHTRPGLLGAFGARVNRSFEGAARIEDVAPTVLALLGLEATADMDGKVIGGLVQPGDHLEAAPEAAAPTASAVELSADDQAAIERHLRDLGYEE
jgi:predicted AlkP superfamily phosphohydrolase/phosphomutase